MSTSRSAPLRQPSLQAGYQRPQFKDRISGAPALPGGLRKPQGGLRELQHGGEVGVVSADHPEQVRRDRQAISDARQHADVADLAGAALDAADVGLVQTEDRGELGLAEPVGVAVGSQDRSQVTAGERCLGRR